MMSCNGQEKKVQENTLHAKKELKAATVEFISYWDKNDTRSFITSKAGNEFSLTCPDSIDRNFNQGDLLEIKWNDTDTVHYDLPLLVSAHRIKEGPLSIFLKKHKLELQYSWKYECSGGFVAKSYSIIQYYFSITQNEKAKQALVALSKNDPTKKVKVGNKIIDYIIEKEIILEKKKLIMLNIGIFTYGGARTKIEDVYYENETNTIYELNQNTHKLVEI